LGFLLGCPYTLATYLVEGKSSKEYLGIKKNGLNEPALLKAILQQLPAVLSHAAYQIESVRNSFRSLIPGLLESS
jgi:uroporphyrinogen decarboxylase